ncbi:MAG: N,N-dimethylformamidase beta subunit family domain-containing protein [Polyangiales bacterium]
MSAAIPGSMHRTAIAALTFVTLCISTRPAFAGFITDENAKAGVDYDWVPRNDGTSFADGVADMYPASYSIARGEPVRLKVRSTTGYTLHVYRVGWYGGAGAREVATRTGLPADGQPYPAAEPEFGAVRAGWHDSVTIPTDDSWTPGIYVARLDQSSGKQAATFFVVRDTGFSPRPRILVVVTLNTHQAYNAWPGAGRNGKSLYAFNSSPGNPKQGDLNQAVKVSFDRPFLVGVGLADLLNYEVPYVRWLEKNGWDVAYCTDQDLHADPGLVTARNVFSIAGHWEYVSRPMVEHMRAARDAGTHLLLLTGDTISYQVRFEDSTQTMVGYKESWPNDPENIAGLAAQQAGDTAGAMAHYRMVSRGWRNVGNPLTPGEPGMLVTGVHSGGAFGPDGPWGDLVIDAPDHWLFEGTGFKKGDRITRVMGYEFDSAEVGDPSWDPFRPAGQVILGTIIRASTGEARGNAAYYRAPSGAEVVALGAVEFAWSLDKFASTWGDSSDPRAGRMITNALTRFTAGPPPDFDAGPPPNDDAAVPNDPADASIGDGSLGEGGTATNDLQTPNVGDSRGGCGCETVRSSANTPTTIALLLASVVLLRRRRSPA